MNKGLLLIILPLVIFFSSCSSKRGKQDVAVTDTIPMMIMQIQKCSRLYTAEYHVHKIITHDDILKLNGTLFKKDFSIDLPVGKRKVAIPMDATLKAYIDFSKFTKSNIRKHGDKIEIILPDPKVTMTGSRIDHNAVKQYVAFTRSNFTDEELTNYERQGREAIIKSIPEMGIIDMARESAARVIIPMIEQMGYNNKDITVSFRKEFTISDITSLFDKTSVENGKAE